MPRKAIGDRPLTQAERSARKRQRRNAECDALTAEVERLHDQVATKDEALHRIRQWADAYPTDIFPEIDTDAIKAQIGENAYAALHASWARHIMDGVKRIASAALPAEQTRV